jgi:hypothetical protein
MGDRRIIVAGSVRYSRCVLLEVEAMVRSLRCKFSGRRVVLLSCVSHRRFAMYTCCGLPLTIRSCVDELMVNFGWIYF